MANAKISQLPAATVVNAADVVPIVQSGTTKKATLTLALGGGSIGQVALYDANGMLAGHASLTYASNVLTLDGVIIGLAGMQLKSSSLAESYLSLSVDGGTTILSNTGSGLSFYATSGDIDLGEIGVHVLNFAKATGKFTFPAVVEIPVLTSTPVALASLGSAATAGAGARAFISDGLTLGTWGATAVNGGTVKKPVFSDGTNWLNG